MINENDFMIYSFYNAHIELQTLEGDMIEVSKLLHGLNNVNPTDILTMSHNTNTRGHSMKLMMQSARTTTSHHSFSHRVVLPWNSLPEEVATAGNLNTFKNRLDRFWKDHPIHFDGEADPVQTEAIGSHQRTYSEQMSLSR